MKTWIAFFKAVNVGGNNILPMRDLARVAEEAAFIPFETYIQSGNCAFKAVEKNRTKIADKLSGLILASFGFSPLTLVLDIDDVERAITANPYTVAEADANKVHLFFLYEKVVSLDFDKVKEIAVSSEKFQLTERVLYFYAPDGIGKSKLFAKLPQLLTAKTTVRNLRTVRKISDIARTISKSKE